MFKLFNMKSDRKKVKIFIIIIVISYLFEDIYKNKKYYYLCNLKSQVSNYIDKFIFKEDFISF